MICEDVQETLIKYRNKCSKPLYDLILEEKNKLLHECKNKLDNYHKMKLSDVEAYKLKFQRKGKGFIDLCEKMVLSNFDTDSKMELTNINYPLFCLKNNQLVDYTIKLFMETKPSHVSEQSVRDIAYTIAINYNIVPYHNYTHGFSVAQFFYYMYTRSELVKKWIPQEEVFIIV